MHVRVPLAKVARAVADYLGGIGLALRGRAGLPMTTVELLPSFVWTCDACGRDQFERGVTMDRPLTRGDLADDDDLDDEEVEEMLGLNVTAQFLRAPVAVRCRACGASFVTNEDEL